MQHADARMTKDPNRITKLETKSKTPAGTYFGLGSVSMIYFLHTHTVWRGARKYGQAHGCKTSIPDKNVYCNSQSNDCDQETSDQKHPSKRVVCRGRLRCDNSQKLKRWRYNSLNHAQTKGVQRKTECVASFTWFSKQRVIHGTRSHQR